MRSFTAICCALVVIALVIGTVLHGYNPAPVALGPPTGVYLTPSVPQSSGAVFAAPVTAWPHHRRSVRYRITRLAASLSSDEGIHVNDRGQILSGTSFFGDGRWVTLKTSVTASGHDTIETKGLNGAGEIVGSVTGEDSGAYILMYSKAVIWRSGKTTTLPLVTGAETSASGTNDKGEVVGHTFENSNDALADTERAFLYRRGKMIDIGRGEALCLNDRSQVVVQWRSPDLIDFYRVDKGQSVGKPVSDTYVWDRGRRQYIVTPPHYGDISSEGFIAINNRDQVAGTVDTDHSSRFHTPIPISRAFIWRAARMRVLGAFAGEDSAALGLNNGGQVVGKADTHQRAKDGEAVTHAFLWRGGRMQDLNDLVPAHSGWVLSTADAINDRGQIVGSGNRGAFLLTPLARR